MTPVIVAPRREGATSAEDVVTGGYFQYRPSVPYSAGGQWVQDIWTNPINLDGSAVTVDMDALASIPYELYLNMPDGKNNRLERSEFRYVTASGVALKWEDLVLANGPGAAPVIPSDLAARVAVLEAAILVVSGGASTVAGITDMSAPARTFNQQGTYANMRTTLGAAASDAATITTTLTAANPTFTGTVTLPGTVTIPNGTIAEAAVVGLVSDLAAKAPLTSPTFAGTVVVPTAVGSTSPVTKAQLDSAVAAGGTGAPDATGFVKGLIQLGGDLAGTASAPTVPGKAPLASPTFTGVPAAPTAADGTATTQLATTGFVRGNVDTLVNAAPGSIIRLVWTGSTPVRPSTRTDIFFDWEGPMPHPNGGTIVTSPATGGMYEGDRRSVTAF